MTADKPKTEQTTRSTLVANRYRVEKTLGQGGMAVVYQVVDTTTKKRMALKQLLVKKGENTQGDIAQLFEHEFHTLAQLAHPRVIEVYDYGIEEAGAYYTMELLDGGDLRELSPLPWKKACALLSDICSALSLLHSRRQVHRDLTTRNVRCTRDTKAKLIDFGAMVPMGSCKQVVGTPPFTAPEAVTLQALDARADLYSLGATLYYALAGRHAYPARNFSELREMWRSKPRPPSSYAADIPKELDSLVLSLINPDLMARPANAAEVMERLSAIAGLEMDEQLVVSRAYLSTPTLVGRDELILQVKQSIARALGGNGGAIMIEGASGVGRSRFLDACVLEGKLSGAVVLKADASDARAGGWGAVRAMAIQMLEALPEVAMDAARPHLTILGHAVPELLVVSEDGKAPSIRPTLRPSLRPSFRVEEKGAAGEVDGPDFNPVVEIWGRGNSWRPPPPATTSSVPPETFSNPYELRPRVQKALRDWFLLVGSQRFLMLAADDVHRIDEPSAAFLALLSHELSDKMMVVAVTAETDAPASSFSAVRLLRRAGDNIKLRDLGLKHVEDLLFSVFGEASNVRLLADRLYAISRGNPRAVMQLTQYLVDSGLIRYQAGAWTLPSKLDPGDLPYDLSEALKTRLTKLSADALSLARTLSLSPERSFSFEECLFFSEHRDRARLVQNLDDLIASEVLSTDGEYYWFSQQGWVPALKSGLDEQSARAAHLKFAELLEKPGLIDFRVIQHLLAAGQEERALDLALTQFNATREELDRNPEAFSDYVTLLPMDWIETLETLLQACERLNRPRNHGVVIRFTMARVGQVTVAANRDHLLYLLDTLSHASGLSFYQELSEMGESPDRLWRALELAQQHYDSLPESERVMVPAEAVRALAQVVINAIPFVLNCYDYSLMKALPSVKPLIPLAAPLDVVEMTAQNSSNLMGARYEKCRAGYLKIIEKISQPDMGGLDESYYNYTRLSVLYAIGLIEASLGMNMALERVTEMDDDPLFQVNGWRVRMVYYLRQGDFQKAEECKKRLELLQIQNSPHQFFEGAQLWPELLAYSSSDDLMGIKQILDDLEKMAKRFEGWAIILCFAKGEYQRIRGDNKNALAEYDKGLGLTGAGRNPAWPYLAGAKITAMAEMGDVREAFEEGRRLLQAAEEADLDIGCNYVRRPLALIEAKLDEYEEAIKDVDAVLARLKALNITGVYLGQAYETRARIAILTKDHETFNSCAKLCAEQYKAGRNPGLSAKYEKLMQEARQDKLLISEDLARAADFAEFSAETVLTLVAGLLVGCRGPGERAERALELLVRQSNCSGGYLYIMQEGGPVMAAQIGDRERPANMDVMVKSYIEAELDEAEEVTQRRGTPDEGADNTSEWSDEDQKYRPVILGHSTEEGYAITGLAVLALSPGKLFNFPHGTIVALSKTLLDSGDAITVYGT